MLSLNEIDEFLEYLANIRKYSQKTIETYKITLYEAAELIESFEEGGKNVYDAFGYRKKISRLNSKTIAKKISTLRSFFDYKQTMGERLKTMGLAQIKTAKTLPKPIGTEIIAKALNECENLEERLLVGTLYALGLRISELENLKIADIGAEWVTVRGGKGGKDRMIPLLPEVRALIERHLREANPAEYLFEEERRPLSQNCLRYRLSKIFNRVGVKATPHQLRHSFATDLLNKGARIVDVSELLGHKELATTQIYTKLNMNKKLFSYLQAHPMCKE